LGAVMLFFVLSGFVLSLPAINGRPQTYFTFAIRRVFRIYAPYLAALAVSVAGAYWLHGMVTASPWFHKSWSEPVDWHLVGQHLVFVGAYNTDQFDSSIWSLVHEMRISLIFPGLCWLVLRLKTRWSVAIAGGLAVIAYVLSKDSILNDWQIYDSLNFAGLFVLGIVLARERDRLGAWFLSFTQFARILAGLACLWLLLLGGPTLAGFASPMLGLGTLTTSNWITAVGAGGLIIMCMNSDACRRLLHWSPIRSLGEISYSLYLWHFIVMLFCVHLLYGRMPLGAILGLILIVSLVVSWGSYRWIELPSIAAGRRISNFRWRSSTQ
jgi:peptidoglycan/LPS O-acetylase OafA/YrhL